MPDAEGAVNPARLDAGILVLSCDRYADLWGPYFQTFFDHWGDCPFPLYLAANERSFGHPKVRTLLSGPDVDWSSSILAVLKQFPHEYVITLIEDAFFLTPLETPRIMEVLEWTRQQRGRYVRLRANPGPNEKTTHPAVGRLNENALYRTALHGAMWETAYLADLLVPGESAWHYEINSPRRTRKEPRLYSTWEDLIPALHGVEKGQWFPEALEILQDRGYLPEGPTRGVLDKRFTGSRRFRTRLKALVRDTMPPAMRGWVHRAMWNWFR